MAQLNANLPYINCFIRNKYIFGPEDNGLTEGYIFGVKSMINRPMHFHFQASFGAVFWMMPISAFCHKEDYDPISDDEQRRLSLLQTWDCQDNDIAVTTFGFLQHRRVDVFCRDRVDGIWSYGVDIADFAAGSLIAQEGGALVSNFNGDPKFLDGNNIICATAKTYKSILKSVKPYFKD